jgi:hypothetical protein
MVDGEIWPTEEVLAAYNNPYAVSAVNPVPPNDTPTVPSESVFPVLMIGAVTEMLPEDDICDHVKAVEPTVIVPDVVIDHEVAPFVVPRLT